MTFKFDKYVAAYLCIRPSQHLSIQDQFLIFNLIFSEHGWVFWCHQSKLSRSDILRKHGKTGYRLKSFYNALYMFLRPCGIGGDNKAMKK